MAKGQHVISLWDYDKEPATVTLPTVVIDETNLVLQSGYMDTFLTAINGVSLGVIFKDTRVFDLAQIAGVPPIDPLAQREKKWLVQMTDAVTFKAHVMTIPGADLSLLDAQNRGQMDKTNPAYTLLKSSIENFYLTEAGNAVVVGDVVFVGRNL